MPSVANKIAIMYLPWQQAHVLHRWAIPLLVLVQRVLLVLLVLLWCLVLPLEQQLIQPFVLVLLFLLLTQQLLQ